MTDVSRDWQQWHRSYDDPASSLSRRLEVVRGYLARALSEAPGPVRLISLCAGDGRDSIPVIAASGQAVKALLVELDEQLAQGARTRATDLAVDASVRNADAGLLSNFADHAPADVFMLCGVFGNITTAAVRSIVAALPFLVSEGALVIWTRGDHRVDVDGAHRGAVDPSDEVRAIFAERGFTEIDFTRPNDASFRVGLHRWSGVSETFDRFKGPERLFEFVR